MEKGYLQMSLAKSGDKTILDFGWAPRPKVAIFYKMRGHRDTEGGVKMAAETGVMYPPPETHRGPPADTRSWERGMDSFSLRYSRRKQSC